jgi:tRNA(adenine34) deaminase
MSDDGADESFMRLALAQAALAAQAGEVPVGAVVVYQGRVIGQGHNQTLARQDITAHAEMEALRQASQALGNHRLQDCALYVTLEPCLMCSGALMSARISRLVYGASEPKTGAAGSVIDVFAEPRLNHHTALRAGVLAVDCAAVLAQFFQARRQDQAQSRGARFLREDALRPPPSAQPVWPDGLRSDYLHGLPALEGLRLHVLAAGQGGEAAVILLHGAAQWSAAHAQAAVQLAHAGLAVYAPDLPGFGLSDKPKKAAWHSLGRHAQVLRQWMATLPQRRLAVLASVDMAALLGQLKQDPAREGSHWFCIDKAPLPPAWQDLPYPDAGHRVGLRALPPLLAGQSLPPGVQRLGGDHWPLELLAVFPPAR